MKDEHRKLRKEALEAKEAVERAHAALATALARRSRLSKQLLKVEDKAARALDRQEEAFSEAEFVEVASPVANPELDLSSLDALVVPGEEELPAIDWSFLDHGWGANGAQPDNPLVSVDPIAETS
ncbi:hypothetical protein LTR15_009686 [Elasticomyces elasticus]|nr:hypothetical protein LTR15_009686 [Elasticomyces elasticus]